MPRDRPRALARGETLALAGEGEIMQHRESVYTRIRTSSCREVDREPVFVRVVQRLNRGIEFKALRPHGVATNKFGMLNSN
jgi:hypothetical protein